MRPLMGLILATTLTSCASFQAKTERPQGWFQPKDPVLAAAIHKVERGGKEFQTPLKTRPAGDGLWHRYGQILALQNQGSAEAAYRSWQQLIDELKTRPRSERESYRLLARCLSHLAALAQQAGRPHEALALDGLSFQYLLNYGSPMEAHRGMLSLGGRMRALGHGVSAANLLQKSLEFGGLIEGIKARTVAQFRSHSALAELHTGWQDWRAAEKSRLKAYVITKRLSSRQDLQTTSLLDLGELYLAWVQALKADGKDAQLQVKLARQVDQRLARLLPDRPSDGKMYSRRQQFGRQLSRL